MVVDTAPSLACVCPHLSRSSSPPPSPTLGPSPSRSLFLPSLAKCRACSRASFMAADGIPVPPRRTEQHRQHPSRPASATRSARSPKHRRRSESPIYVATGPRISPEAAREARRRLFDALERGERHPGMRRPISCADHLSEPQLAKFFAVLHACGRATDDEATPAVTRQSMDGFLDAAFLGWTSETAGELLRPEMDFEVDAEVVAGKVCRESALPAPRPKDSSLTLRPAVCSPVAPDRHGDVAACAGSGTCTVAVSATAAYSCNPAMVRLEFSMVDPFTGRPETFCPIGRDDIRWIEASDWRRTLRQTLLSRMVTKIHRFNKHLAIWQARRLMVDWSKGGVSMGQAEDDMGFVGREAAVVALMGFGESAS
ncbi:hypothetical protein RJ55_04277 [Drechmeria coniospora]|nr:hypothetical protein RJ55_04277 [Drechmeria coniospora]